MTDTEIFLVLGLFVLISMLSSDLKYCVLNFGCHSIICGKLYFLTS
jgi:hypothetical protein